MVDRICDNCMNRVPADADRCPKCGIRFENTNPGGALPNGWVLGGRYTVGRYIDIDGEGVTYSAIDGNSFQRVIIKEYMPVTLCSARDEYGSIVPKPGCEVLFKTTRMDFGELYSTLVRMGRAEGLVNVLDMVEENNTVYAILEKIEGLTLSEYLMRQEGPVDPNRALAILRPVMLGVEALHSANVVHRGISPDNIVLESGGTAKLGGYATLALRQQGSELKPKLYAGYSAPEQYSASEFEGQFTDVYALGAVLYRMLTGETPEAADERRVQDTLRPVRTVVREVPSFLSTGIGRALRVNSEERIQTIGDLRLALSGESNQRGPASSGGSSRQEKGGGLFGLTRQQTIIGAIALGAVVLILLIVLLIAIFGGGGSRPDSDSSSSVSTSSLAPSTIPNLEGLVYSEVIASSEYAQFTFDTPTEEYSPTVEEGKIISQSPAAGQPWGGTTKIKLVVSLGAEPVIVPDFSTEPTTRAEAELELTRLKIEYEVNIVTNDGSYRDGDVVKTDPAAGEEIVPGKDKLILYVAGEAATAVVPDVTGDEKSKGVGILKASLPGLTDSRISYETVSNDGTYRSNAIVSTNPPAGTTVTPGSMTLTVRVADVYRAADLNTSAYVGQPQSVLTGWLDARSANYSYSIQEVANDGSHTQGVVQSVQQSAMGIEVAYGTPVTVTIYVFGAPSAGGGGVVFPWLEGLPHMDALLEKKWELPLLP